MANRQDDNQPTEEPAALSDETAFDETLRRSLSNCIVPTGLRDRLLARVQVEPMHAHEADEEADLFSSDLAMSPVSGSNRRTHWKWVVWAVAASLIMAVLGLQLFDPRWSANELTVLCVQELVPHSNQPEWSTGEPPAFWDSLRQDLRLPGYQLVGYREAEHCIAWKLAAPGRNDVFILDFSDDYQFEGLSSRLSPQSPLGSWSFAAALYQNRVVVVTMLGGDVSQFLESHPSA